MVFVRRNASGEIVALSRETPSASADSTVQWEEVPGGDPEVMAFVRKLSGKPASAVDLKAHKTEAFGGSDCVHGVSATDAALIRVLEDLIDVLVERGVLRFTDLPAPAQAKLTERRSWRADMRKLTLLDDDESDVV